MILSNAQKVFTFSWCKGYSFESIANLQQGSSIDKARLCFISTEARRIYLVTDNGNRFYWKPYCRSNNAWRVLPRHTWNTRAVTCSDLSSEESLVKAMEFQMVCQWRDSIESWYDSLPTHSEICNMLTGNATIQTLDDFRVTYYEVGVQSDPEWDGAIQVICDGGVLVLPYTEGIDKKSSELLVEYATFIPDSKARQIVVGGAKLLDCLISAFQNIRWINIRTVLDGVGGSYGKQGKGQ